jgi:hypothetical protein
MAKARYKQIITPVGELSWCKIKVQEEWKGKPTGKYSVTVKFSQEDHQKLLDECEVEYKKLLKESDVFKGFKPARNTNPSFGDKELPNGDIVFKFTTKAEFENKKTGEVTKRIVPVFDAVGRKIDVNIGNGTKGKVAISIVPKNQDAKNYGTNLWMDALQIIELVEYGANQEDANAFGFGVEDGYVADQESTVFDGDVEEEETDEAEEGQVGDF